MPTPLYLDTARMGPMAVGAQLAVSAFARFTSEVGLGLYGERFFREGVTALPAGFISDHPQLGSWRGCDELKKSLIKAFRAPRGSACLLAGRSINLVRAAAQEMAAICRRVFLPDLCWPAYAEEIVAAVRTAGGEVTPFPARRLIFSGIEPLKLLDRLFSSFDKNRCDGAFIPAVSSDGLRLPIDTLAHHLRERMSARYILVDGAQAVGHVPNEIGFWKADLIIASSHKWLRAGLPLGFAIGGGGNAGRVGAHIADDPLAQLSNAFPNRSLPLTETVNVWPLIACSAAIQSLPQDLPGTPKVQEATWEILGRTTTDSGWGLVSIDPRFRTGIVLMEEKCKHRRGREYWRRYFSSKGISLSSFGSRIRISPAERLGYHDFNLLQAALYSAPTAPITTNARV